MKPAELETLCLKAIVADAAVSPEATAARLDASGVSSGDFTDERAFALFGALADAVRAKKRPEVVSVLKLVGQRVPRDFAIDVLASRDTGASEPRLSAVREAAKRRQLGAALDNLAKSVRAGVALDEASAEAHRVAEAFARGGGAALRGGESLLMDLVAQVEANAAGTQDPVLPTGLEALDLVVGGLQPTLTVLGSLPAVGKSALMAAILGNLTKRKVRVGLLSLEDSADWVVRRLGALASDVPVPVLAFRRLGEKQRERFGDACNALFAPLRHLVVDDRHGLTTDEVVASARQMVAAGCKAIFVDHLGEIRLQRSERHDLDITDALQALRGIAKAYKVPVVVACHLKRREGLDARTEPKLTDFAFSSGIERMARVALGLWRSEDQLAVTVLKQTQGPANVTLMLNMAKSAGLVLDTPPTEELRRDMRELWGNG